MWPEDVLFEEGDWSFESPVFNTAVSLVAAVSASLLFGGASIVVVVTPVVVVGSWKSRLRIEVADSNTCVDLVSSVDVLWTGLTSDGSGRISEEGGCSLTVLLTSNTALVIVAGTTACLIFGLAPPVYVVLFCVVGIGKSTLGCEVVDSICRFDLPFAVEALWTRSACKSWKKNNNFLA